MVPAKVEDRAGQQEGRGSPGERERWPSASSVVISPPPEEASCLLTPACEDLQHWAHAVTYPQGKRKVQEL